MSSCEMLFSYTVFTLSASVAQWGDLGSQVRITGQSGQKFVPEFFCSEIGPASKLSSIVSHWCLRTHLSNISFVWSLRLAVVAESRLKDLFIYTKVYILYIF